MKKFRLLSLIIAIVMITLTLTGCGDVESTNDINNDTQQSTNNTSNDETSNTVESEIKVDTSNKGYITTKDEFVNKMAELLDISLYDDLYESDNTSFKIYGYDLSYENETDYDLDYKVKLGDGSEFTMPITFNELESKGWTLQENSGPEEELDSGYKMLGAVKNASGKQMTVDAYNPTEETIKYKDCTVISVELQQYSSDDYTEKLSDAIDFTVCESLNNASTLEDIIKKLGNPTSVSCSLFYDDNGNCTDSKIRIDYTQNSDVYSSIAFELSGEGNYITKVEYNVSPDMN